MKLIKYLSAQQIEFLSIFNQIENTRLLLSSIETIKKCKLSNKTVKKHNSFNKNIKKYNFLTEETFLNNIKLSAVNLIFNQVIIFNDNI